MKKIIFLGIFLLGFITASQAQKFGYLNSAELLQEMPEWKQAQSKLEAFQTQMQKKGQQMIEVFQTNVGVLQQQQEQGELSPKQLETERAKLMEEQAKIEEFERDMQTQVLAKQEELVQPLLDKINEAIADVAKENSYTYIFDGSAATGVILYADEAHDVIKLVKTKLGMDTSTTETQE